MESSRTWTKRLSSAMRSISSAARSGEWMGTTMEARSRGSRSSHSLASQLLIARHRAAERSSLIIICAPWMTLQMANSGLARSSTWARSVST